LGALSLHTRALQVGSRCICYHNTYDTLILAHVREPDTNGCRLLLHTVRPTETSERVSPADAQNKKLSAQPAGARGLSRLPGRLALRCPEEQLGEAGAGVGASSEQLRCGRATFGPCLSRRPVALQTRRRGQEHGQEVEFCVKGQ
jgi:hypothetical protein